MRAKTVENSSPRARPTHRAEAAVLMGGPMEPHSLIHPAERTLATLKIATHNGFLFSCGVIAKAAGSRGIKHQPIHGA